VADSPDEAKAAFWARREQTGTFDTRLCHAPDVSRFDLIGTPDDSRRDPAGGTFHELALWTGTTAQWIKPWSATAARREVYRKKSDPGTPAVLPSCLSLSVAIALGGRNAASGSCG
jgi:hypothetical protein